MIGFAAAAAAVLVTVVVFAVSRAGSGASPEAGPVSDQTPAASTTASSGAVTPPAAVAPSVATATVAYRPVEGPQIAARRLATPPGIDGKGDDWPVTAPIVADYAVAGNTATVKRLWSLGWDADNLHLLLQVVDPEVTTTNAQNPARLFEGDAVTLQFGSSGANADGLGLSPVTSRSRSGRTVPVGPSQP
jgi:hypothetical protein